MLDLSPTGGIRLFGPLAIQDLVQDTQWRLTDALWRDQDQGNETILAILDLLVAFDGTLLDHL